MDRIIRLNAPLTSSQSDSSGINCYNLHPDSELIPKMAFIYAGIIAVTAKPEAAITNTSKFISLQKKLLHQLPNFLLDVFLFGSIIFFTAVIVWLDTEKIEEVSHIQGKFVPLEAPLQTKPVDGVVSFFNIKRSNKVAL